VLTDDPGLIATFYVEKTTSPYYGTYVDLNITNQHLMFIKNGELIVETDVISGSLWHGWGTPIGTFRLLGKTYNTTLTSTYFGYSVHVDYWMPFTAQGHGMHDSYWNSTYGGTLYKTAGSHGCVNMPHWAAEKMFYNIAVGTEIRIHW